MDLFSLSACEISVLCEDTDADARVRFQAGTDTASVFLTAAEAKPRFVKLRWTFESAPELLVLGDAWERSYADLEFLPLGRNDRAMPWYFLATDGKRHTCFGVKTQPNAFVSFRYDVHGLTALLDCRNGGSGVWLNGRTLCLAEFVRKRYDGGSAFDALCDYCKLLCEHPLLPTEMIYGGNNWYYAYGESSRAEILSDAKLQAALAKGLDNRPFMVADDGWQRNRCAGPWLPNEKYGDMKTLADEMRACGVRPGLWVRLLYTEDPAVTDELKIYRDGKHEFLDPTLPQVQDMIRGDIARVRAWGFELLKHDFSTVDLFGRFGKDLTDRITDIDGWHFADRSKTSAEIALDFYRLILQECGDMLVLGCNTVSHLCAGLVHLNRIGDDTSGRDWGRTRDYGVNTLAFRLAQNGAFYLADADCVGILKQNIPWEKNRQWLDLLAKSGTALFVSCADADETQTRDLAAAYRTAQQPHRPEPLDWFSGKLPAHWRIDGKETVYDW